MPIDGIPIDIQHHIVYSVFQEKHVFLLVIAKKSVLAIYSAIESALAAGGRLAFR